MRSLAFGRGAAPGTRLGSVAVLAATVLALCLGACGDRRPDPAGPGQRTSVQIRLRAVVTGGMAEAFARVDSAHVTVTLAGATLLDTVAAFAGSAGGGLALAVPLPDETGTITVAVELLAGGKVVFRGGGSAQLQRGAATSVPITVAPVVGGVSGPDSVTMTALGDTLRLRAAVIFPTGDTVAGPGVTWGGDTAGVISLTADGLVTSLREGQASAIASYQTYSHTTSVLVRAIVAEVDVSADTFSLFVDSTRAIGAVARDRNGHALQRAIGWSSSNPGVARVDAQGVVKGVGAGTATITASSETQSAHTLVTVRRVPVGTVRLAPPRVGVIVGDTARFVATTLDVTGKVVTDRVITWTRDSAHVATVDSTGLVRALAVGTTLVKATCEGVSDTARVYVVQPTVAVSAPQVSFIVMARSGPTTSSVSITNSGGGTLTGLSVTVSYGQPSAIGWLGASLSRDTAPATLTLTANPAGLPSGNYTATVTVASTVPNAGTVQIPVSLAVRQPVVGVSRNAIDLQLGWRTGSASDTLTVLNVGTGLLTDVTAQVSYAANEPTGWLAPSPLSWTSVPVGGASMSLVASGSAAGAAGLPTGTYHATVTLSSTLPGAGTAQVAVTLVVVQPILSVSRSALQFQTAFGPAGSASDTLTVSNVGSGTLTGVSATISYAAGEATGWLAASPSSGLTVPAGGATISLTATASGLAPGTYHATATFSSVPGAGTAQVSVMLYVQIAAASDVTYSVLHSTVRFWNVAVASVSAGTISGNTAVVPPGATIRVTGSWQMGPVTDVSYCPYCIVQVYVAWVGPAAATATPINQGLYSNTIWPLNPQPGVSGRIDFTTTAPTAPGEYYLSRGESWDFAYRAWIAGGIGYVTGGATSNQAVSFRIRVQ